MVSSNYRPSLKFLSRAKRQTEPSLRPQTSLLPRRVFEADADLLAAYERFVNLRDNEKKHTTEAGKSRLAAESAQATFEASRREALAAGTDATTVKNTAQTHLTAMQKHLELADAARGAQLAAARTLAHLLAEKAPALLAPSEERIKTAGAVMANAIDALEAAWIDYDLAWRERRVLGNAAVYGGPIANFDSAPAVPVNVAEAFVELRSHLGDLDTLKAEEQIVDAD